MRQLELELPVFMRKWNKPDGTLDKETPVRMTAWLQEVMPQGIKEALEALKARLGTPKPIEEGKEIRTSKIYFDDTGTSAFKEVDLEKEGKPWQEHRIRRGMQPSRSDSQEGSEGEEEVDLDHKNFMAFDCSIANPRTKRIMNTRMHIDSMSTKCIISHQMA